MIKNSILAGLTAVAILSLVGCAVGGGDSTTSKVRAAAFVKAKDGTLYSVSCLKEQGSKIASGVAGAGKECAAEELDETQVRGIRGLYGNSNMFYTVNPANYYGGSNTSGFCSQYFGVQWNGCFSWLGYNNSYYNSTQYQPTCGTCLNVSISYQPYYYQQPSCPNSCSQGQYWNTQPWYQNWNSWNWWYTW